MRFRLRPGRSWGDLVTAVVVREDDRWTISSWIDAPLVAGGDFETLDEIVQAADALVCESYPAGPRRPAAELQYAIYPWSLKGQPESMFDVTGKAGALTASDISGTARPVRGKSAEDLVEQASRLTEQPKAMFRWVKKINDLADEQ